MNSSWTIPAAVVGGYVLGRRRKARMAMLLGAWLAGRASGVHPLQAGKDAVMSVRTNPALGNLGKLTGEMRGQLVSASRNAAIATANSRLNRWADQLHGRTESLTGRGDDKEGDDKEGKGPEPKEPENEEPEPTGGERGHAGEDTEGEAKTQPRPRAKRRLTETASKTPLRKRPVSRGQDTATSAAKPDRPRRSESRKPRRARPAERT